MSATTLDDRLHLNWCRWSWIVVVCVVCSGCASLPYRYGNFHPSGNCVSNEVVIEYGKPQKTLDNLAWFTGIWSRMLPLNSHINRHALSDNTREKLIAYLEENDLTDVLIRVNQYDPKGEWRRLRENHRICPGWRYTAGVIGLAHYTLVPGRVFGGDHYNAFTNTLYINSDVPAVVIHEAAYAKDVHGQLFPGCYAAVNELPVVCLWRHTRGVNDALGYAQTTGDWAVERETYRVVYPQMGVQSTTLAGPFVRFPEGILISMFGAAAGHFTGQVAIAQRQSERIAAGLDSEFTIISGPDSDDEDSSPEDPNDAIQPVNHESDESS